MNPTEPKQISVVNGKWQLEGGKFSELTAQQQKTLANYIKTFEK